MHHQYEWLRTDESDGIEILDGVIRQFLAERRGHGERCRGKQGGIAIGCCLRHDVGADHAGSAGAIVNHKLLTEAFTHFLAQDARHGVGTAGRELDYNADRTIGIDGLRGNRGCQCGQQSYYRVAQFHEYLDRLLLHRII